MFHSDRELPKGFVAEQGLDTDKMAMVPRDRAMAAAHACLHPIQDLTPEEIALGVSVLFAALVQRCKLDPMSSFERGSAVLNAPFQGDAPTSNSVQVLKDFLGARVMGQRVTIQ